MMNVVLKWKVIVNLPARDPITFCVSDNHVSNVLRMVASMDFSAAGMSQPAQITIIEERRP